MFGVWSCGAGLHWTPALFFAYRHLVWSTATIIKTGDWNAIEARQTSAVIAVWHQEYVLHLLLPWRGKMPVGCITVDGTPGGDNLTTLAIARGIIPQVLRSGSLIKDARNLVEVLRGEPLLLMVAVDGPNGPSGKVQGGVINLTRQLGLPVFPLRAVAKPSWHDHTWDKRIYPRPFGKLYYNLGEPQDSVESLQVALDKLAVE